MLAIAKAILQVLNVVLCFKQMLLVECLWDLAFDFSNMNAGLFRGSQNLWVCPQMPHNLLGEFVFIVSQETWGLPLDDSEKVRGCGFRGFSFL